MNKPGPEEYVPFYATYVSKVGDGDIIKILEEQMLSTHALAKNIPAEKAEYAYAPGKWTVKECISHMIDAERVFAYRALCISRGEQQNLPGFEQDDYVLNGEAGKRELNDLIAEFKTLRMANLFMLRSLTAEQADRIGSSNGNPTSVRALAHMMAGHELHHMNIFREKYL